MLSLLIIPVTSLLHFLRGRGLPFGKWIMLISVTWMYTLFIPHDIFIAGIVLAGLSLWLLPGVGKGFLAIHGRAEVLKEKEIPLIDSLTNLLYRPNSTLVNEAKIHGLIWMTLRGLLTIPLFVTLAIYTRNWPIAAIGLVGATQGAVYYLNGLIGEKSAVMRSEIIMGAIVGLMLWVSIWLLG